MWITPYRSSAARHTPVGNRSATRGRAPEMAGTERPDGTHVGRIAVFPASGRLFDYTLARRAPLGSRVRVKLGQRVRHGVLVDYPDKTEAKRLRAVEEVLEPEALVPPKLLQLLKWVGGYYQSRLDRVLFLALPSLVRRGDAVRKLEMWHACADKDEDLARAPRQAEVLKLLRERGVLEADELEQHAKRWRPTVRALVEKGLVAPGPPPDAVCGEDLPALTDEQSAAFNAIKPDGYQCHLLDGVTGSGKTMIYMHLIRRALNAGRQVLVLAPEIGLTYELLRRCQTLFGKSRAFAYHSDMSDTARARVWGSARAGEIAIVVGARSAVFMPFARLGLVIVDEEHDESYKEKNLLLYHARDVAITRARDGAIPVVLGSATPALETLWNVKQKRYQGHTLAVRYAGASLPEVEMVDTRGVPLQSGLSPRLTRLLHECLERKETALLFLNRRGYAPRIVCHSCGESPMCPHCDQPMVRHHNPPALKCHHCDASVEVPGQCAKCGARDFQPVGLGTERIEEGMRRAFAGHAVTRFDADAVRHRNERAKRLESIAERRSGILIGTQMLAKGHHFPTVTLVGILNIDQCFFSTDFRALERLGQLIVQVSGRAGREDLPGRVALQTRYPSHPVFRKLFGKNYGAFAQDMLDERKLFAWPPFRALALVRAEARNEGAALACLERLYQNLKRRAPKTVDVHPPFPSSLEKIADYYRARMLLLSESRKSLAHCLRVAGGEMEASAPRSVRWRIDVDPLDIE